MLFKGSINHSPGRCFLSVKIGFPAHEAKKTVEEVLDALRLLHRVHKEPVKSFFRHILEI